MERCPWCGTDPLYTAYHDQEWGVPERDERRLFECLILEGAQAGLSWITVLRKRENYRRAMDNLDPEKVARYDDARVAALLQDAGLIRNRLKMRAAVENARAWLELRQAGIEPATLIWNFVDGEPRINHFRRSDQIPTVTPTAEALSKELRRRGFRFVGPTIMYAFMQAAGLVNDHLVSCPRHRELTGP